MILSYLCSKPEEMKKWLFLSISLFLYFYSEAQGCSQCRIMAEQGSGLSEESFTNNMNFGILYLMAFPYIILMVLFRKPIIRFVKSLFAQGKSSQ
ncbi:MAG: hypothetical protein EBR74_10065 [Flavobacteriia bacterium]|nr:hypothetical protein [Flavobacteriia bacterium]